MSGLLHKAPKMTLEKSMVDFTLSIPAKSYRKVSAVQNYQLPVIIQDVLKDIETF